MDVCGENGRLPGAGGGLHMIRKDFMKVERKKDLGDDYIALHCIV